jgi:anthranilate 1,2-dioxygenase small subunit
MSAAQDLWFAIAKAQADHARCLDDDRLEQWPDFFTDDCLYRVTSADNMREGYEASLIFLNSKGMVRDRVSALRTANIYERQAYRHILGQPSILSVEGESATSETSFMVARIMRDGRTDLFATGRYLDTWRRADDGVLLSARIVVCDSSRIDTLLALPL